MGNTFRHLAGGVDAVGRERSVAEERLRFVARLLEGEGMSEVCRDFGISRKTGYKTSTAKGRGARRVVRSLAAAATRCQPAAAGQKLGIKEVDDGIWLVSFMHYDLGYIDLEQKTLQTLDNPFGPRLSPMS